MRIVHLVPGTGNFHCGSCLRDQSLAVHLRRLGHEVLMVPVYLPLVLEPAVEAAGPVPRIDRIFYGGLNVFLQQKLALFRRTPWWLDRLLDAPGLLRWAARRSNMTGARDLADLTLSMLAGEEGRQAKELAKLLAWLASGPRPELVTLSNVLLAGMARRIRRELAVPVVCTLQGEDSFLDSLPEPFRAQAWALLARRCADIDAFIAISGYYRGVMVRRLGLAPPAVHVVHNGIDLAGFEPAEQPPDTPVLGYLARLCHGKGLTTLVDAFLILKRSDGVKNLRLHVAGAMTAADGPYVAQLRAKLASAGVLAEARFSPNLDRAAKQAMLRGLSVFSVPATYGEAFGLYVLEALAAGVPVVQPRHGAFEELLAATGGGLLCPPDDPAALAASIQSLLLDEPRRRALAGEGRRNVCQRFGAAQMAAAVAAVYQAVAERPKTGSDPVFGCPVHSMPAMLQLEQVSKRYAAVGAEASALVLDRVDLAVQAGEMVAVTGPSGSGKSTLLNVIGGLDRPGEGHVRLEGVDLARLGERALARVRNRRIGFVFQAHHLLPQCTALENVLVPTLAGRGHMGRHEAAAAARRLLERVGLGDRLHHRPGQLSGGQCQRVAVVRALINRPALVLADEPTGSLDRAAAEALADLLVELNRQEQVTLIVATHAPWLSARMGRRLDLRDGRLHESGTAH